MKSKPIKILTGHEKEPCCLFLPKDSVDIAFDAWEKVSEKFTEREHRIGSALLAMLAEQGVVGIYGAYDTIVGEHDEHAVSNVFINTMDLMVMTLVDPNPRTVSGQVDMLSSTQRLSIAA